MNGLLTTVIAIGWILTILLWFQTDQQRRDLLTDMCQLAHDGKIKRDDLRRARDIDQLERRFDD